MDSPQGLALLAVDVQPVFFRAMDSPEVFLRRCRLAVSAARLLGLPTLFTEQAPAKLGPTHPDLLLLGLEGPVCVHQTAIEAVRRGLGVTVLADAVTSRRPGDQAVCFEALRQADVSVLPVETVFYSLLRGADHPAFKDFTELVKAGGQVRSTVS